MASTISQLHYRVVQGHDWERLIIVKDRRAHRIRRIKEAAASYRDSAGGVHEIPVELSYEGGVALSLAPEVTALIEPGEYPFDVVADPWGESETVAQGILEVLALDRITPLIEDA